MIRFISLMLKIAFSLIFGFNVIHPQTSIGQVSESTIAIFIESQKKIDSAHLTNILPSFIELHNLEQEIFKRTKSIEFSHFERRYNFGLNQDLDIDKNTILFTFTKRIDQKLGSVHIFTYGAGTFVDDSDMIFVSGTYIIDAKQFIIDVCGTNVYPSRINTENLLNFCKSISIADNSIQN